MSMMEAIVVGIQNTIDLVCDGDNPSGRKFWTLADMYEMGAMVEQDE